MTQFQRAHVISQIANYFSRYMAGGEHPEEFYFDYWFNATDKQLYQILRNFTEMELTGGV